MLIERVGLGEKVALLKTYASRYRWYLVGVAVGLILVLGIRWLLIPPSARIVEIYPGSKATGVSPKLAGYVEFDGPVKTGQVKVTIIPESKLDLKLSADRQRLDFTPQTPLVSDTSYTLRVSGGVENPVELSFKTGMLQGKDPGFGDPSVNQAVEKEVELYPLADKLPYYGEGFRIVYAKAGEYAVTLFGKTDAERQIQKAKALKWLEGQGVESSKVVISWQY